MVTRRPSRPSVIWIWQEKRELGTFSGWVCRQRDRVERFFNRIKPFRGIATRYDREPANWLAAVKLGATRL